MDVWTWLGEGMRVNWETGIDIYTLSCVKQTLLGAHYTVQGAQLSAGQVGNAAHGAQLGTLVPPSGPLCVPAATVLWPPK